MGGRHYNFILQVQIDSVHSASAGENKKAVWRNRREGTMGSWPREIPKLPAQDVPPGPAPGAVSVSLTAPWPGARCCQPVHRGNRGSREVTSRRAAQPASPSGRPLHARRPPCAGLSLRAGGTDVRLCLWLREETARPGAGGERRGDALRSLCRGPGGQPWARPEDVAATGGEALVPKEPGPRG